MTLRDERGAIVSREAYTYEFDKFGNWTRMVTSLVVFENGELKRERPKLPTGRSRITSTTGWQRLSRSLSRSPRSPWPLGNNQHAAEQLAAPVPEPSIREIRVVDTLKVEPAEIKNTDSTEMAGEPPPLIEKIAKVESAFAARKTKEVSAPTTEAAPAPVPVAVSSDQKMANDLYLTGRSQFDAGDVRAAVQSYLQSIKLEPGSAEVFLNLGHAYLKLDKDRDAINAFKSSVKLNPEVAEAFTAWASQASARTASATQPTPSKKRQR